MSTAVSSSYQDSTDHSGGFIFQAHVSYTHSALDIELTEEEIVLKIHFFFIVFSCQNT